MTYGWERATTKLNRRYIQGETSDSTGRIVDQTSVFSHGQHLIHVPGDVEQIGIQHDERYRGDDVDHAFPSATVKDGKLEIHVEDFVTLILSRLDPVDLAQTLWQNDEVKEEFMRCLANRWTEAGVNDKDRREFLTKVKATVHDVSMDNLVSKVADLDFKLSSAWNVWDIQTKVNSLLRHHEIKEWVIAGPYDPVVEAYPKKEMFKQFDFQSQYNERFGIGGMAYDDAKNYWRQEITARFLGPTQETDNAVETP